MRYDPADVERLILAAETASARIDQLAADLATAREQIRCEGEYIAAIEAERDAARAEVEAWKRRTDRALEMANAAEAEVRRLRDIVDAVSALPEGSGIIVGALARRALAKGEP